MADSCEGLVYKGRPLMREGNTVFYGSMTDQFIVKLTILESKDFNDLQLATKVVVTLEKANLSPWAKDRIVKKGEKDDFYTAFELGSVWLERALASK